MFWNKWKEHDIDARVINFKMSYFNYALFQIVSPSGTHRWRSRWPFDLPAFVNNVKFVHTRNFHKAIVNRKKDANPAVCAVYFLF